MYHFSGHEGEGVGDESTKVIIDGRTNVTPPDIQEMIGNAFGGNGRWEEILNLYQPNAVLWHGETPFVSLLLLTGDWCKVYEAPQSLLKHTVLIKKDEYEARKGDFPNAQCRDNG